MRICIPLRAKNLREAEHKVKKASGIIKNVKIFGRRPKILFEIWLDKFWNAGVENIKNLIKSYHAPVIRPSLSEATKLMPRRYVGATFIAVCRGKIECGSFRGSEKERIEILKNAVLAGVKFVDVGIQTDKKLIRDLKKVCKRHGAKLIISKHVWDRTPELHELLKIYKNTKALGADIVKIATQAKNWSDNVILFELVSRIAQKGGKIIAVGMGERGKISRIGCPLLGSYLIYVALDENSRTAEGQLTFRPSPDVRRGEATKLMPRPSEASVGATLRGIKVWNL